MWLTRLVSPQTNTGGSDGAGMRYELEGGDPANAGLQVRAGHEIGRAHV